MPVHIFQVDETNFEVCKRRGLAGIFDVKKEDIDDTLISHLMLMHIGDPVLFYVGKSKNKNERSKKELHGIWKVASEPFYDTAQVWEDKVYPYRICVEEMGGAVFETPIQLSDIYHLRDIGRIWTFSLMRNSASVNAVFSMTNQELDAIYDEFIKLNPDNAQASYLHTPYILPNAPLIDRIRYRENKVPRYESSLMALLAQGLHQGEYSTVFRHYSDYSMYVPTNWGKEIDILLLHEHPNKPNVVSSYDIIEVKRDQFNVAGLEQLLDYEAWFIKKRVKGDSNMVRSVAIAQSFHQDVIEYLKLRAKYEKKRVLLLTYKVNEKRQVELSSFAY